ncbi:MAG TPA: energy transducer TonB [Polyangium sp.]|nr:energy transducer TonB [Polyangium sp.]
MRLSRNVRLFLGGLIASSLGACASGPDKQDPLVALAAEDKEEPQSTQPVEPPVDPAPGDAKRSDDGTVTFGRGMSRPTQFSGPSPSLPPKAIENHISGQWMARCVITETGSVEECKVIKGLPHSDAHLLQILQSQTYTPVIYEGKPQRVYYTFKITFR